MTVNIMHALMARGWLGSGDIYSQMNYEELLRYRT